MIIKRNAILLGLFALAAAGCDPAPDKPNMNVPVPKEPAAMKILSDIKALPTPAARRRYMNTHQQDVMVLRSDPGSWREASKLAWEDVKVQPNSMESGMTKSSK